MKKSLLALAVAGASIFLAGCEPSEPTQEEINSYVDGEAQKQVRAKISAEESELKEALRQMQAVDPTIKDIYYGVDDKGNRVLHVVHENQTAGAAGGGQQAVASSGVSDMVWPLVGGMAAGALAASMINSGSLSNFASHNPPASSRMYAEEERRRERNVASSGYVGSMMNSARSSVRSSPNFNSSMRSTVIGSRSSGVFSGSSARAGGYSSGS